MFTLGHLPPFEIMITCMVQLASIPVLHIIEHSLNGDHLLYILHISALKYGVYH